jgi:hypothetical protein
MHHSEGEVNRQFSAVLNVTDEISADEVDKEIFFLEMGCPRPLHQLMHTAVLLKI